MQTDRQQPFCRPSWLSFVGKKTCLNLNQSLMEAIYIWNLEEIWSKMAKLEWPQQRTDRRTDAQTDGQAENNRASPTCWLGPNHVHVYFVNIACRTIIDNIVILSRVFSQYFFVSTVGFLHMSWIKTLMCLELILIFNIHIMFCYNLVMSHLVLWNLASAVLALIAKTTNTCK